MSIMQRTNVDTRDHVSLF